MKGTILPALAIVCFLILVVFGYFSLVEYSDNQRFENKCLIEQPRILISGKIVHSYGFFPGPDRYYLYCKGKTRKAREECEVKIAVTESEYERQMYNIKD